VHDQDEESLGQTVRVYWTQFAKTGNPNFSGLSEWPAYTVREDQYLELGRKVALRQVPERLKTLEQTMVSVIGDTTGSATGSLSTN
jgi:para-nitrobenzyl esterase